MLFCSECFFDNVAVCWLARLARQLASRRHQLGKGRALPVPAKPKIQTIIFVVNTERQSTLALIIADLLHM